MASDILAAEHELVVAFLEYVDWNGNASAAYDFSFGTKREGNPIYWSAITEYPECGVESYALQASDPDGAHMQQLRFTMRVSMIHKYAAGEVMSQEIRELRGKVIENILQTFDDTKAAQKWVGLDWIERIWLSQVHPRQNELEAFCRAKTLDLAGTGAGYTGAVVDFMVQCVDN